MASILKVDAMQGVTSAGDITITSEGGAATQSLQQGLAKVWVNFNGEGTPAMRDSLNAGAITDNGTGDYTISITSSMGNGNYSITTGLAAYNGDSDFRLITYIKSAGTDDWSTMATGSFRVQNNQVTNGVSAADPSLVNKTIHGDLA